MVIRVILIAGAALILFQILAQRRREKEMGLSGPGFGPGK